MDDSRLITEIEDNNLVAVQNALVQDPALVSKENAAPQPWQAVAQRLSSMPG